MNKATFLDVFYTQFVLDVVGATDELLQNLSPSKDDEQLFYVASKYRLRPDIFKNVYMLGKFVLLCLDTYPRASELLLFSMKVSPSFISSLFSLLYIYECKKND